MVSQPEAPDARASTAERRRRFTRNVIWNYAAGFTSIFGLVLLYPLAIQLAGAEKYGLWVLAFGATQLLVLTDFGIGDGIVRQMGAMVREGASALELRRFVSVAVSLFGVLAVGLSVLYVVALPLYLRTVTQVGITDTERTAVIVAGTIALFNAVTARGTNAVLWAQDRQDIERKSAVVGLLVRVAGYTVAFVTEAGLIGVIIAEVIGSAVTPLVCAIAVARRFRSPQLSREIVTTYAPPLLRLGSVLFAGSLATLAATQLPLFIVGSTLGLVATTAFGALMRVFQSARLVNSWMANPFIHGISSGTGEEVLKTARLCFITTACVGAAMSAVIAGLAPDLIVAWLGGDFLFAAPALAAMTLGMLADALVKPSSLVVNLRGAPARISLLNVGSLAVTLVAVVFAARTGELVWISVAATAVPLLLTPLYVASAAAVLGESPLPTRPLTYLAVVGGALVAFAAVRAISFALPPWPAVLVVGAVGVVVLGVGVLVWRRRRASAAA